MLQNLSAEQFGQSNTNASDKSANGQSSASTKDTTTLITVKGTSPSISTRST